MAMKGCLLLVVVAAWSGSVLGQISSYCQLSRLHTLCVNQGLGSTCGGQVQFRGVRDSEAAFIVALHNQFRSRVALGQEGRGSPGPQPQAANMRVLEWDFELANVAQSHADQCIFEHECPDCRRVSRFGVGQNLLLIMQNPYNDQIQWERAVRIWYDEVVYFNSRSVVPFRFSTPAGHYTMMMWWNSHKIGCGFTMSRDGFWWKKLYTCNYGPGGNIIFSEMYRPGFPCSACPFGTACSLQYPGLCEDVRAFDSTVPVLSHQHDETLELQEPQKVELELEEPQKVELKLQERQRVELDLEDTVKVEFELHEPQRGEFELHEPQRGEFELHEPQRAEFDLPAPGVLKQERHRDQLQDSDLMPFLQRAGVNKEVIHIESLSSARFIINSLPFGVQPIVLYRSLSGRITELDPGTLLPVSRFGQSSASTGKLANSPVELLTCDLDVSPCDVTPIGASWKIGSSPSEGRYLEASLGKREVVQIGFQTLVGVPSTDGICVGVSHRRTPAEGTPTNASIPEIKVVIMPLDGNFKQVPLGGTPGLWEMSRVSFSNIKAPFLVAISIDSGSTPATVAIDALQITDGICCLSGIC